LRSKVAGVRLVLLLMAAAGLALGLAFLGAVGPSVLRPLSALTHSAREVAEGRLDSSVQIGNKDEVGQLADAFNVMTARLRTTRRQDLDRLARTRQTVQRAIDSLRDAIIVLNQEGEIELTNRAAMDVFGLTPAAVAP